MLRALLVFGTRPEAIKLAPVIEACRSRPDQIEPIVCLTGQHREMLAQVIDYFQIEPDISLNLMQPNQSLAGLTARCIESVDEVLVRVQPRCVVVQGDTTTVMATALSAFYRRVPVVHVEAGLRTGNLLAPWPEEMNRRVADLVTALYCAPTPRAAETLLAEGAPPQQVHITGNTVIDALVKTLQQERSRSAYWQARYAVLGDRPLVLITGHRRESFGQGLANICQAIAQLAKEFSGYVFLYPVHLNPNVQEPVRRLLSGIANLYLTPPVAYPEFVWLMDRSRLILTDSGGIQEEAPTLRKPVLVMRETTERPEAVESGAARVVGSCVETIVEHTRRLLLDPQEYAACQIDHNPYGDGQAAQRIVSLMLQQPW